VVGIAKKIIRNAVRKFLYNNTVPISTREILAYINKNYSMGSTMHELCNILSKDQFIMNAGQTKVKGTRYGTHPMEMWTITPGWKPPEGKKNSGKNRTITERRESRQKMLAEREWESCKVARPIGRNSPNSS
jgi:hypothetical protein